MTRLPNSGNYVALLRAVNVGGRNRLPMAALAKMFVDAGCTSVRTYIQSGNVVFRASAEIGAGLEELIPSRILKDYGFRPALILRNEATMRAAVEDNPFIQAGDLPEILHVYFLAERPDPKRVAELDPQRSPPDSFVVHGREIYLRTPAGIGNSKLTAAWFDSKLGIVGTARNWRTSLRLLQMLQDE